MEVGERVRTSLLLVRVAAAAEGAAEEMRAAGVLGREKGRRRRNCRWVAAHGEVCS